MMQHILLLEFDPEDVAGQGKMRGGDPDAAVFGMIDPAVGTDTAQRIRTAA